MNQDPRYAPFRPELTAAHEERIRKAANQTDEYARIAIEQAKEQLSLAENTVKKRNALPDIEGVCLRIPDVDPRGQYSILDMRALQRIQTIDAVLNLRERAVSNLVYDILQGSAFQELLVRLQQTARRHRLMIRAEKLCWDDAAADRLHIEARKLETDAVVDMDLALQALEHFLGMRPDAAPAEVERFCRDTLGVVFTPGQREAGRRRVQPEEATILFANFDNVLLQVLFAMPENWGLTIEELEALRDEE